MTVIVPIAPFSRSRRVRAAAVLAAGVVPADGAVVPGGGAYSSRTTHRPRRSIASSHFSSAPFSAEPANTSPPSAVHSPPVRMLVVNAWGNDSLSSPPGPDTRRCDLALDIVVTSTGRSWKYDPFGMSGFRPIRSASRAMYRDAMSSSTDGAGRPRNSLAPRNRIGTFMSAAVISFTPRAPAAPARPP